MCGVLEYVCEFHFQVWELIRCFMEAWDSKILERCQTENRIYAFQSKKTNCRADTSDLLSVVAVIASNGLEKRPWHPLIETVATNSLPSILVFLL